MIGVSVMRPEDIPACLRVVRRVWDGESAQEARRDLYEVAHSSNPPRYFMARICGEIVGLAGYSYIDRGTCDLLWVGVLPEQRGQGIGSVLVRRCIAEVADLDCNLMLTTKSASAFYAGLGFETVLTDYWVGGGPRTLMLMRCPSDPRPNTAPSTGHVE